MNFASILQSGWETLLEYLSAHVLTCLVPAFFIAGAIAVFVSQASVIKYFGAKANKFLAYGVASVSGAILAVCSCTILPLFAGIHKKGSGLGPAMTFLYSGPAINILAIVYTARLLGYDLGLARAIGAISFSILIGLIMAFIWRKEEREKKNNASELVLPPGEKPKHEGITILYFAVLVGILVFGAAKNWLVAGILLGFLVLILYRWFKKEELKNWMYQTWDLGKKIFPLLIVGVFLAGVMKKIVPQEVVEHLVGGNGLRANLIAALFGAFMYFSTLMEVPVLRAFMDLGMGKGPVLTMLLADPALSLPSIVVLAKLIGIKKTGVYVGLVVVMSTIVGMAFGAWFL